jgi:hypothetical protein
MERIATSLVCIFALPLVAWSQSAVWQPQAATTGNIYYNGGNVGIGTSAPDQRLTVVGNVQVFGNINLNDWSEGYFIGNQAGMYMPFETLDLRFKTSSADRLSISYDGNVGIGTTNPQYKLAVEGAIGARDIVVSNTPWSDYVFRPDYRLQPLSEVDRFIRQHRHLPDIPTEAEVKEKGVSLGEMQAKLLAKIEELTLHMIQLEKDNRELRKRFARIEKGALAEVTPAVR